jgi:tetratricopeptide (TPR) repeat protein
MSINKIVSYGDELSRQLGLSLHLPGSENYLPLLLAGVFVILLLLVFKLLLKPLGARIAGRLHFFKDSLREKAKNSAERKATVKSLKKALAAKDYRLAADLHRTLGEFREAAKLYLEAKEHGAAARAYEDAGDFENAAVCYRQIGNHSRAAENFLKLQDYPNAAEMFAQGGFLQKAAELYEKTGAYARAAELYEACFIEEGLHSLPGQSKNQNAFLGGTLFRKAGEYEKAIQIFLRGNFAMDAALICEGQGEFMRAAECFLQAADLERAAECFRKGGELRRSNETLSAFFYKKGSIKEAAVYAEEAGDLLQASEMFAEAGEYAKAGDLLAKKGHFGEAGEMFLKIDDFLRAAEAFEKGGRYLLAADAYLRVDDRNWRLKAAELYEKGEDYFRAGEIFTLLNLTERALSAFQKTDADSPHYAAASMAVGKMFLEKGMIKLALEKFLRVIGNRPVGRSTLEAYYYLALCYEASGEKEKAKAIYQKILAEDYHYRNVNEKVLRL